MTNPINADLHCHSTVSDGTLEPEVLAARAKANGVELWALTDHDEVGGQQRALEAAQAQGLKYLTGVEISVTFADATVHIVGLGFDHTDPRMTEGLADTRDEAQPLLSEHYYVRKALQPYAQLTEKKLGQLLDAPVDAIIMGDRGVIDESDLDRLTKWIEGGGVLIRFAGPRLAAQGDPLTPVDLRPTSRALGSSLSRCAPGRCRVHVLLASPRLAALHHDMSARCAA